MEKKSLKKEPLLLGNRNGEKNVVATMSELAKFAERVAQSVGSVSSLLAHTVFFVGIFSLVFFGFTFDQILLILTTLVSLEAIYLAIFIQMTVNRHLENIEEVREDIEDIQEDVEDISEDIEDIQKDVDDIQEDVEDISEDIDKEESEEDREKKSSDQKLEKIEMALQSLVRDIEEIRKRE